MEMSDAHHEDEIGVMTKQLSEEQGSISVYTDRQILWAVSGKVIIYCCSY